MFVATVRVSCHVPGSVPAAQQALTDVLSLNAAQNPSTSMEVDQSWPPACRRLPLGSKAPHLDIWALALFALDGKVLRLANRDERASARDENAT